MLTISHSKHNDDVVYGPVAANPIDVFALTVNRVTDVYFASKNTCYLHNLTMSELKLIKRS